MSRSRKSVVQKDANEMMQTLSGAGYTREQLLEALNLFFPEQDSKLVETTAAMSLEDVKVNTSTFPSSSLRSLAAIGLSSASELDSMAVASNKSGRGKLKASAIADEKEDGDNDFYIEPEDLVQDQEEPIQQLSQDQRKRGASKDSESSTETIVGKAVKSTGPKARFSLGSKTATPGDRGRTAAGPQVEHALAYVAYESISKKAIAGQKISEGCWKDDGGFLIVSYK